MKYLIKPSAAVKALAAAMDWKSLLDHASCPHFDSNQTPEKEYGAVFFHAGTHDSLKQSIGAYVRSCKIKPLVTTDMEAGPGGMITDGTKFPSMMACGRCGDEDLAYTMGAAAALEGRDVGFNWSLAPCVDLSAEIDNPILGIRSAGSDPDLLIRISRAYIRGMQDHSMAATLKHFPGDGFSVYDQHLTTSVNPLTQEQWRAKSGRVFKELIDAGAMAVMPGHIALPSFDVPDERLALCPPATLSKRLMVDLLRHELGFDGLIVSDAVNMGGIASYMNYYDACATFWENGGDCLLFEDTDDVFYREMEKRFDNGKLSIETMRDRVERILAFKEQMNLFGDAARLAEKPDSKAYDQCAQLISERSLEVVRDRAGILPFKLTKDSKILHVVIANEYEENKAIFESFTKKICEICPQTIERVDPGCGSLFSEVQTGHYDLIICSMGTHVSYGTSTARLYGPTARNMMKGWMRLGTPTVFVCHSHPFTHHEFEAAMDTVINTYGSISHSLDAVTRVLFDTSPLRGKE